MNPSAPGVGESDSEVQRVLERVSDAFFALDTSWEFTYLNDRAEEILETPRSELLGRNIWEMFPEATESVVYEEYRAAMETQEPAEFDVYYEPLETWFHIVAYPSEDGLSVYFTDITFSVLKDYAIETAEIGIVITDPHREDNPIIYANEGFERLTGYSKAEARGQNCRFLQGSETQQRPVAEMARAIQNDEPVTVTLLNYKKSGIPFWNRVSFNPVTDSDGTVTHFIGFQQDVTALVEREQRVQLLQRVLRHNLRTEMNVLLGNLDSVSAGLLSTDEGIERAERAGKRLLRISEKVQQIDSLLASVPHEPEAMSATAIIESAIKAVSREVPEADISLTVEDDDTFLATRGIGQAVEELISNALTHAGVPDPFLEITVERTSAKVAGLSRERSVLDVQFADSGPRLPDLDRQTLLAPTEDDPLQHGTGLGLWLVHWLVTLSGGQIKYQEREPKGNLITLQFLVPDS